MAKKECSKCEAIYGVHYCNECHFRIHKSVCKTNDGLCVNCKAAARGEFGMRASVTKMAN
jgi:hypothetical protein